MRTDDRHSLLPFVRFLPDRMGALTKIVGPSTPVGGVLMIAGYLSLVRLARI
jgi:uncharacterized membrane protein YgdD (TMEM256/DUF423 family)